MMVSIFKHQSKFNDKARRILVLGFIFIFINFLAWNMPPVKRNTLIEELMMSTECFCGKACKESIVKKEGPNKDKIFYSCAGGLYNPATKQRHGGCNYFRMEGDPMKQCPEVDCGRTMSIFKRDVGNARCVNQECPAKLRYGKQVELVKPLFKSNDCKYGCKCDGAGVNNNFSTKQWPLIQFYCGAKGGKRCNYNAGLELLFNHPIDKKKPTDMKELFCNA